MAKSDSKSDMVNIAVGSKHKPSVNKNGRVEVWILHIRCSDGDVCTSAYTSFEKLVNQVKLCVKSNKVQFTKEFRDELKGTWYLCDGIDTYLVEQCEVW